MNNLFTKKSLVCLLIIALGRNIEECSAKRNPAADMDSLKSVGKSIEEPIEYVLGKLKDHDLVMIGERHWRRQEPVFIQGLIKRCFEENAINVVLIEFGNFEDQGKIDAFMASPKYDRKAIIDCLRNYHQLGWGYQEYFDIFKLIYDENNKRPPAQRIRLILSDPELMDFSLERPFYDCLKMSPLAEKKKWKMITWLRESIMDRDQRMAAVIEAHIFESGLKGIYYAGSSHIRKDLQKKGYGRQYFSAGGVLARKYPGRVCCLAFHKQPELWQNVSDFNHLEELFQTYGRPFAIDTKVSPISRLRLKGDILQEGVPLCDAFDGYIMLNRDKDYQPCALVPGFYDDKFARIVWGRFRKAGYLDRLSPELSKWKDKAPTGAELTWMIEEYGLR
ncbi:MAG: hypothetical protein ACYS7Y_14910 [Planctomycetota bacterium]|jgi:hypothetical protein